VIIVVAVVSLFALSNREMVSLGLWPLPFVAEAPLYLVVAVSLVCGVLIGAVAVWIKGSRRRDELREYRRQNAEPARELTAGDFPTPSPITIAAMRAGPAYAPNPALTKLTMPQWMTALPPARASLRPRGLSFPAALTLRSQQPRRSSSVRRRTVTPLTTSNS
jgi:uncharacterized integral membrane protein